MKITRVTVFAAALCAALALGCAKAPKNADAARAGPIVCLGDSVTAGLGVEPAQAYPSLLAALTGRRIVNAGVSGDTTADALERLDRDVLALRPGLVIIELGGNDYLKQLPLAQTGANMSEIIRKVQAAGAMAAVVDPGGTLLLRNYSAAFKEIAAEHNAFFFRHLLGNVLAKPSLKTDQVHPNAEGHKKLAGGLYDGLKRHLK